MSQLHRNKAAPRTPAGTRNWWHPGVAGRIIRNEFFTPAAAPSGNIPKYWTGSAWKPLKGWTGIAWQAPKVWDGMVFA